jgi:periplasmic protein TonB
MAVQIFNDMPDVAVHRGEPLASLRELAPQRPFQSLLSRFSRRAWFVAGVAGLHILAIAGFMAADQIKSVLLEPEPMVVSLIDAPAPTEPSRDMPAPSQDITVMLSPPQDVAYEADTITPPPIATAAISNSGAVTITPPIIESVEYVRAPAPVYPGESSRRRERGTVLLRVLVDALGRPAWRRRCSVPTK